MKWTVKTFLFSPGKIIHRISRDRCNLLRWPKNFHQHSTHCIQVLTIAQIRPEKTKTHVAWQKVFFAPIVPKQPQTWKMLPQFCSTFDSGKTAWGPFRISNDRVHVTHLLLLLKNYPSVEDTGKLVECPLDFNLFNGPCGRRKSIGFGLSRHLWHSPIFFRGESSFSILATTENVFAMRGK